MRARKTVLVGLIVVMVLALVGCGSDDDDDETVLGGKRTADLVINDKFPFYEPTEINMPANREVTFTVLNEGEMVHNITIPDFNVDMDVAPDQTIQVKLPAVSGPGRDGFFTFYCKYHQAQGEAMKLKVSG